MLRGDLGQTVAQQRASGPNQSISSLIREPLGNTLILAGIAVAILIPTSLLIGSYLAIRTGRPVDHAVSTGLLTAISLPEFVTAALLVAVFATALGLLPPVSLVAPGESPLEHPDILILPVITLLASALAQSVRMVRASMIEALRSPYVIAARLGGVSERIVLWRYALRNALAPTVQVFAFLTQWLVGSVVVAETVFAYPGLGTMLVNAVDVRDVTMVQAVAMLFAAFYIAINILADLIVIYLNPRLRTEQ
jgi:peptide/nickel transport system permease protein